MFRLLLKYLILNKRLIVQDIGTFFIERKSAKLDFANKLFIPPAFRIKFTPAQSPNDSEIYAFISHEQKIDEPEAVRQYESFINNLKENLAKHKTVEFLGLGALLQTEGGELSFKETVQLEELFSPVAAERVIRENIEHHVLVGEKSHTNTEMKEMLVEGESDTSHAGDYWWIFAIALGIIGVATIVYYYLNNGRLH